jgi:hypothetical protein
MASTVLRACDRCGEKAEAPGLPEGWLSILRVIRGHADGGARMHYPGGLQRATAGVDLCPGCVAALVEWAGPDLGSALTPEVT